MNKDRSPKQISLFLAALLLFNFPLIGLFSKDHLLWGLPLLYVYLFFAWACLIAITAWISRRQSYPKP